MADHSPHHSQGRRRGALRVLGLLIAAIAVAVVAPQIYGAVTGSHDGRSTAMTTADGVNLGVATELFQTHDGPLRARLSDVDGVSRWAQVLRTVHVYRTPGGKQFTKLQPTTPEHTEA